MPIKTFCFDNPLEVLYFSVSNFCENNGIIYQTSCYDTPKQNGAAKRRNRHLLKVALLLLFHMQVPKRFWGNVVLTACFLINPLPSNALNNQSPFCYFISISFFVFCFIYLFIYLVFAFCFFSFLFFMNICMCCFMHYVATSSNTLSLWTTKCIFLGYSKLKKGYKCFDPTLGRYLISADATIFLVSLGFSVKRVDSWYTTLVFTFRSSSFHYSYT